MSETTLVDAPLFPRLIVRVGGRVIGEEELRDELSIGRGEERSLRFSLELPKTGIPIHPAQLHMTV